MGVSSNTGTQSLVVSFPSVSLSSNNGSPTLGVLGWQTQDSSGLRCVCAGQPVLRSELLALRLRAARGRFGRVMERDSDEQITVICFGILSPYCAVGFEAVYHYWDFVLLSFFRWMKHKIRVPLNWWFGLVVDSNPLLDPMGKVTPKFQTTKPPIRKLKNG